MNHDYFVYPGHPVVTAYYITQNFSSLSAACTMGEFGCPEALSCHRIPGGGTSVYNGLDLLRYIKDKDIGFDLAVKWADEVWAREMTGWHDKTKLTEGQEKADQVKEKLKEILETWPTN